MRLTIDIPDEVRDRDGKRYEPTGEFRLPVAGDRFLMSDKNANYTLVGCAAGDYTSLPAVIIRPVWTWPEWLGGWGIAQGTCGRIMWHSHEPEFSVASGWVAANNGRTLVMDSVKMILPAFTPPTITDWTKPILNPRWKQPNV